MPDLADRRGDDSANGLNGNQGEIEAADCPEQSCTPAIRPSQRWVSLKRGLLIEKEAMNSAFYG